MSLEKLPLIPYPMHLERFEKKFRLTPDTALLTDEPNRANAEYLRELLVPATGYELPIQFTPFGEGPKIIVQEGGDPWRLGAEGYLLTVYPDTITIYAPQPAGTFYGIQTLRQLLPDAIESQEPVRDVPWEVPCVRIGDAPRFRWRGHMLDEGRHFQGKEAVFRTLDLMARQKLNVFHWHLTEDQGWRIEIKRYPKLTEIGAWRSGTAPDWDSPPNDVPHGGFYTQDEIREVLAYAEQRHIMVVPEIEMPGHSLAALAAYPKLSCFGGPFRVSPTFGIFEDVYCAGKESTFTFLQNVLDEVMDLFPSPFIHTGGDEVPKTRWRMCPDCQRRIRDEGLKDEHELQVYFTNRIAAYLDAHGRRLVGWNEILAPGLVPGAVAQYWYGNYRAVEQALRDGRDVIVSDQSTMYLDHSYKQLPLRKAYEYEPEFIALGEKAASHVLGMEAPLWTEFVPTRERQDYQTYPRLTAYAETAWSPWTVKNWADFQVRLRKFLARFDLLGVQYAKVL